MSYNQLDACNAMILSNQIMIPLSKSISPENITLILHVSQCLLNSSRQAVNDMIRWAHIASFCFSNLSLEHEG